MEKTKNVSLSEKFLLTLGEASIYFGIGENKLRNMAEYEEHIPDWIVLNGSRKLVKRTKLEQHLLDAETI